MRFHQFPTAAIILLVVLGLRFSSILTDLASFQSEGSQWYSQNYSPFSLGISNVSTILMNSRPSMQLLRSDKILGGAIRRSSSKRPRILLGISTKNYLDKSERQHRRIIRDTWLNQNFHEGRSDEENSHSVCSLHELLATPKNDEDDSDEECQLVYTFLFPNRNNQTTNFEELLSTYENIRMQEDEDDADESSSTKVQESKHDALFFSVDSPKDQHEVLIHWLESALHLSLRPKNIESLIGTFDYLAFATTQAILFPPRWWTENDQLFQQESVVAGMPKSGNEPTPEDDAFRQGCKDSFCLDPNFLLLSHDMAQHLVTTKVTVDTNDDMDAASTAILKLFQHFQQYEQNNGKTITWKQVFGVHRASKTPESVMSTWDKYVATITSYKQENGQPVLPQDEYPHAPVINYQGNPRMLVGIFTTNLKQIERKRRNALRQTFIRSYDHTATPNRICSLQQLLKNKVPEDECQLAYTFVIGSGKNGSPMVNVDANTTEAMTIPSSEITDPEKDVLYLNIKENMNDGKSETWFKYATLLSENQLYFDYITKMDTDTLLFPYPLFEKMSQWPKYPNNNHVYGGHYVVKQDAVQRDVPVVGTSYMDGPMYWLSPDMARFISDPNRCNHTELRTHAEDLSIGNYVNSFPYPIHRLKLSNRCYAHPLKGLEHYRRRWKRYKKKFRQFHP